MKTVSVLAVVTALVLLPAPTLAQSASTTLGAGVGSTLSAAGADVNAGAGGTLETSGRVGDGQGGTDADAEAGPGTGTDVDTNGDGRISEEEIAAAGDTAILSCSDLGAALLTGRKGITEAEMSAATAVRVVLVADCAQSDMRAALASAGTTSVRTVLAANPAAMAQVRARGATAADILGAAMIGNTLTIFVGDDTIGG